jgi:hypothetical protein
VCASRTLYAHGHTKGSLFLLTAEAEVERLLERLYRAERLTRGRNARDRAKGTADATLNHGAARPDGLRLLARITLDEPAAATAPVTAARRAHTRTDRKPNETRPHRRRPRRDPSAVTRPRDLGRHDHARRDSRRRAPPEPRTARRDRRVSRTHAAIATPRTMASRHLNSGSHRPGDKHSLLTKRAAAREQGRSAERD